MTVAWANQSQKRTKKSPYVRGASPLWVPEGACWRRCAEQYTGQKSDPLAQSAIAVSYPCLQGALWLPSSGTKSYFPEIYGFDLIHSICSPKLGRIGKKSIRKLVSCQAGVTLEAQ